MGPNGIKVLVSPFVSCGSQWLTQTFVCFYDNNAIWMHICFVGTNSNFLQVVQEMVQSI